MEAFWQLSLILALILGFGGAVVPIPAAGSQEGLSLAKTEAPNLNIIHSHTPIVPAPFVFEICVAQSEIDEQDNDTFEKPLSLPPSERDFSSVSVAIPLFPEFRDRVITGRLTASFRLRC